MPSCSVLFEPVVREMSCAGSVALIGHSQGGWVAPLAASRDPSIRAVVCVAGPGIGVIAQEEWRLRHQLPATGHSEADARQAIALLREQVSRVTGGDDPADVHADQACWHDAAWYALLAATTSAAIAFQARIAAYDPVPVLAAVRCPLLAVFGADDVQVPSQESARVFAEAGHDTVVFPYADHHLRDTRADPIRGVRPRIAGFDELITTWLSRIVSSHRA